MLFKQVSCLFGKVRHIQLWQDIRLAEANQGM